MHQRPRLETIQEETEQEDEAEESEIVREDFPIQDCVETKETTTEEEIDDEVQLRVLRPRRLSRLHSKENLPQSTNNQQEKIENFPVSELSEEGTPPKQTRSGNERRSSSGELSINVSIQAQIRCLT